MKSTVFASSLSIAILGGSPNITSAQLASNWDPELTATARALKCGPQLDAVKSTSLMTTPADVPLYSSIFKNINFLGTPSDAMGIMVYTPFTRIQASQTKVQLDSAVTELQNRITLSRQTSGRAPQSGEQWRSFENKVLAFHQCVINAQFIGVDVATHGNWKPPAEKSSAAIIPSNFLNAPSGEVAMSCNRPRTPWNTHAGAGLYPNSFSEGELQLLFTNKASGDDSLGSSFKRDGVNLENVSHVGEFGWSGDEASGRLMLFSKAIYPGKYDRHSGGHPQEFWRNADIWKSPSSDIVPDFDAEKRIMIWVLKETPGIRKGQVEADLTITYSYQAPLKLYPARKTQLFCLVKK